MSGESFSRQPRGRQLLSRGSDLPTVWSNCLAGAWLGGYWPGAEPWYRLALLLAGASALYTAGRLRNEAFDRRFDASRRPARPLPAELGLLAGGVIVLGCLGWKPLALAVALAGLTALRAWWHERTPAGLALMGGCHFLLYPLASAASSQPALAVAGGEGLLLASYVCGLGVLAWSEDRPDHRPPRWPWLLMVLPVAVNAALAARFGPGRLIVVALPVFWLARIAFGRTAPLGVGRTAALLAGIVLIDLSAVAACAPFLPWLGWFAILFAAALTFRRFVPAV